MPAAEIELPGDGIERAPRVVEEQSCHQQAAPCEEHARTWKLLLLEAPRERTAIDAQRGCEFGNVQALPRMFECVDEHRTRGRWNVGQQSPAQNLGVCDAFGR